MERLVKETALLYRERSVQGEKMRGAR